MKDKQPVSAVQTEQAMQQVLQAERDAEQAISDCEADARRIVHDARVEAQAILARADQRITHMEMRHDHKLDRLVKDIDKAGAAELAQDAGKTHDPQKLRAIVDQLAAELCQEGPATDR